MIIRNIACGLLLTAGLAIAPMPVYAAHVDLIVDVAPPAPRVEVVPEARVGYVWSPGYWNWEGHRHVWVGGSWIAERHGWHWVPHHWTANGPHWHFVPGYWERGR